jgi:aminoglycoside phosphotransferase (APT) family kinase protein
MNLDAHTASQILRRADPRESLVAVRLLDRIHHSVWELVCASGSRLVVKCHPADRDWQMPQERYVLGLIAARTRVPVPRVVYADASRSLLGRDYLVMTRIDGQEIVSLPGLGDADLADLYRLLGRALRSLHEIRFDRFGYPTPAGIVEGAANDAFMAKRFANHLRTYRDTGGDARMAARIERIVADGSWLAARSVAVLCHTDLHEANAFARREGKEWRLAGIVDVGGALAADGLFDLAKTLYWSARGHASKQQALLEGYAPEAGWEEPVRVYQLHHALELRNHFARHGRREWLPAIERDLEALVRA